MASKADANLWIRDMGDHYEYMATYVDDILVWSKDPMKLIKVLEEVYVLKGVGIPEYYLGGNLLQLSEHWSKEGHNIAFSAETYIEQVIPKYQQLLDCKFRSIKTPMDEEYHPEIDDSPLMSPEGISKFRSVIGSLNWIITLGRFDVHYATMSLSRFSAAPREGHMKAAQRILAYLKQFPKGKVVYDTTYPSHTPDKVDRKVWRDLYPDVEEELPPDMLPVKGKKVRITVYVDADHAHDLVTRRSVTGILLYLNNDKVCIG